MRFPIVTIIFLITAFGFLIGWGVTSHILDEIGTMLSPHDSHLSSTYQDEKTIIPTAFGIISALCFAMSIIAYVVEALSEEYEYYPYQRED